MSSAAIKSLGGGVLKKSNKNKEVTLDPKDVAISALKAENQKLTQIKQGIVDQLMDFFVEVKNKITAHQVNKSKMLVDFLATESGKIQEYASRDPLEFLQIIESISLVHIDKLAQYKGPKVVSEDFLRARNKEEENVDTKSKSNYVFRSKYSNMLIKKQTDGEADAFGNKQLYELVFKQEVQFFVIQGQRR